MAKRKTGKSTAYSEADLTALGAHVAGVVESTGQAPTSIRAQVEFHGDIARSNNGKRTFNLTELSPGQKQRIVEAAEKASKARTAAKETQPKTTYNKQSLGAKLRQLMSTKKGREALEREGAMPKQKRTLNRWKAGQTPLRRSDRESIARAYEGMRMEGVNTATQRAGEAAREVGHVFDQVVGEAYGENGVRFRDIQE